MVVGYREAGRKRENDISPQERMLIEHQCQRLQAMYAVSADQGDVETFVNTAEGWRIRRRELKRVFRRDDAPRQHEDRRSRT